MNIDDSKLTAYALDELDEAERAAIAQEVAASPEAHREIQETQMMARLLRAEFAAELEHRQDVDATSKPLSANLSDIHDDPWFWSIARPLAIAAVIAVFAVIGLAIFGGYKLHQNEIAQASRHPTNLPLAAPSDAEAETTRPMIALQPPAAAQPEFGEEVSPGGDLRTQNGKFDTSDYGHFIENPFLPALDNPLSTFSVDVDTASYSILRRFINGGSLPPKDAVRIEEMINYFTYDYPPPKADEPFSINVDIASCPWEKTHRLVRIGLKGREIPDPVVKKDVAQQIDGTPVTIAKDVKIQVEFNPALVGSYRLIGYEKRRLRKEDFNNDKVDADEIGAGHMVTALYEVAPVDGAASPSVPPVDPLKYSVPPENARSNSSEMLTVKLRYKKPESDKSELLERAVVDDGKQFANASADFKFAAAVAEFGMLLRDSEFKGSGTMGAVLQWAQEGKSADTNGYRAGFLELVRKAEALKRG